MKTAGVAIDSWKLTIFRKHLDKAGYEYEIHDGLTKDTLTLKVKTKTITGLEPTVKAAQKEADRKKHKLNS